ncbi:hypothetical protein B0T19DRAFT_272640 [Cercophora scortea]|uniref:Uncharacterized protein n=1 Tax=Cercophora scortea TaxID=314031 RepID=A0AAE0I7P3_9PEZI|nr:hypothetical protein B0T19DRAFT_272640 [Cercophora scortea]
MLFVLFGVSGRISSWRRVAAMRPTGWRCTGGRRRRSWSATACCWRKGARLAGWLTGLVAQRRSLSGGARQCGRCSLVELQMDRLDAIVTGGCDLRLTLTDSN